MLCQQIFIATCAHFRASQQSMAGQSSAKPCSVFSMSSSTDKRTKPKPKAVQAAKCTLQSAARSDENDIKAEAQAVHHRAKRPKLHIQEGLILLMILDVVFVVSALLLSEFLSRRTICFA